MNSISIIIFGATGDLSTRKLIPALYQLVQSKQLQDFIIIGAAREETTASHILEQAKKYVEHYDASHWQKLVERFIYQSVDIANHAAFTTLATLVNAQEEKWSLSGSRIIYSAVASSFFCPLTSHIAESGLAKRTNKHEQPWYRIVYEKPFGHDLASAQEINQCIAHHFDEHQIYRIDHYLLKEFVSNIALVRFTNCVLEPLWNNRYIDAVQIIFNETDSIRDRGAYYDAYGAVADVMQNHMLEILALLGMESPEKLTGEYIRTERAKILAHVRAIDALYGQYKGYPKEPHVNPSSKTETFAVALLRIENPRWAGVPFYLKTGKCLTTKETVIYIKFKQVECLLTRNCPSESNYLKIEVSPESVLALSLNIKKPGFTNQVAPVQMEFSHTKLMGAVTVQAYQVLFDEIMRGEESVSVRFDEIESTWRIIDQLRTLKPALYEYEKGSQGPSQVNDWAAKHGMRWRS